MNAKSGRSPLSSTGTGLVQLVPPFAESCTRACSWLSPAEPSDQPSAILSVAPAPVGAPLAISRLGNELVRAPAMPSNEIERTPSNAPTSVTLAIVRPFVKEVPPLPEVASLNTDCFWWESSQTAETVPLLSVRIEQPCRPVCWGLSNA